MRARRRSERHRLFAALYPLQWIWEPLGYARHRRAVARGVRGHALEIGVGTGFSLPHYQTPPAVAIDPSLLMLRRARRRARQLGLKVAFVAAEGEALPFAGETFDTVVSQGVLCTVADPPRVAAEVSRTLRPEGSFRSFEHGISTRPRLAAIQRAVTPLWRRVFAGCRIDRDPVEGIIGGGLHPERVRRCSAGTVARGTYLKDAP